MIMKKKLVVQVEMNNAEILKEIRDTHHEFLRGDYRDWLTMDKRTVAKNSLERVAGVNSRVIMQSMRDFSKYPTM